MPSSLDDLVNTLNSWMNIHKVKDYCPNGLQVQGRGTVSRVVTAVTASQAVIEYAIKVNADAVLVHHGYFWKGEPEVITGHKRQRIKALLENDISLLAYHLPLDIHPGFGNNVQLGHQLGLTVDRFYELDGLPLMAIAELDAPIKLSDWVAAVESVLQRTPQLITGDPSKQEISRIAWCTGGAQGFIKDAKKAGADIYLSGEVSEPTYHFAIEEGIHYVAAGHHATERYGVQALGEKLKEAFGLDVMYFELDNPI